MNRLTRFFAAVFLLSGCGGNDWPATAGVSGTLSRAGKPVAGATVCFRSDEAPRYGYGTTDAAGRYVLSTFEPEDGAIIGEHVVVITADNPGGSVAADVPSDMSSPEYQAAYATGLRDANAPVKNPAVPARYGSPNTSPLRATVKPGDNVIDFDLSD